MIQILPLFGSLGLGLGDLDLPLLLNNDLDVPAASDDLDL